jgi:hypothetical protein
MCGFRAIIIVSDLVSRLWLAAPLCAFVSSYCKFELVEAFVSCLLVGSDITTCKLQAVYGF